MKPDHLAGERDELSGDSVEQLEELIASYHDALLDGDSTDSIESQIRQLDPDSQAEFARAKQALKVLASARSLLDTSRSSGLADTFPMPWAEFGPHSGDATDALQLQRLGRFTIERELGRGGLGVVFLAHDPILHRRVALKVPRPEVLLTSGVRARFDREGQAAARLTHPNLVPVYEVGHAGPISYIVTAYCAGPNLATWLEEQAISPGHAVGSQDSAILVKQLAEAVHYAHTQGVLHRDIKPSNVLLDPLVSKDTVAAASPSSPLTGWTPKLVDFGLARIEGLAGGETRRGTVLGTLGYMSPEQAAGHASEISATTDVYGLGTILYELLTGRGPFIGMSEAECLRQMIEVDPPRPRQLNPRTSVDLEAICLKCLQKNPADRYRTAAELADDLQRFAAGEPIVARPLSNLTRAARWAKRKPWIAGLGSLVAALLLLVAVISSYAAWRIAEERDAAQISEQAALESAAAAQRSRADESAARKIAVAQAAEAERQSQLAVQEAERARRDAATSDRLSELLSGLFQGADATGLHGLGIRRASDLGKSMTSQELLQHAANLVLSEDMADEEPLVRARMMARLSQTCRISALFEACDRLSSEALSALQSVAPEAEDADWALVKQARGVSLAEARKYDEAELLLREALAHATRALQSGRTDELRVADVKFDLGWVLAEWQLSSVNGELLLREVLATRRRLLGDGHPSTAAAATAVCIALLAHGTEAELQQYLLEELAPLYAAQAEGERFTQATQSLLLGLLARREYDLERAILHYRDAIAVAEELGQSGSGSILFSSGHPVMMLIWGELAGTYKQNGQYREAEAAILKVLEISDRVLPNGHLRLVNPLMEYSSELWKRRDFAAAESIIRRGLAIYARYPGEMPYGPIANLVRVRLLSENVDGFLAAVDEGLALIDALNAINTAGTSHGLVEMIRATAEPPPGMPVPIALNRIAEAAEKLLPDHLSRGHMHRQLARTWSELGRAEDAQEHLDYSLELEVPSTGLLSPHSCNVLVDVASQEVAIGHLQLAEEHAQRLLALESLDYPTKAVTHQIFANVASARGEWDAAIENYRLALAEHRAHTTSDSLTTLHSIRDLAIAQLCATRYEESLATFHDWWDFLSRLPRRSHPELLGHLDAIEAHAWLRIISSRAPDLHDRVELLVRQVAASINICDDEIELGSLRDAYGGSARLLRGSRVTTRYRLRHYLTEQEQFLFDQTAAADFLKLLRQAKEFGDAKDKAFPNWQVRQDLELEIGRALFLLKRYPEAEQQFLIAYQRAQEALPETHHCVTGVAEELAAFYTATGREAEAEKYRIAEAVQVEQ